MVKYLIRKLGGIYRSLGNREKYETAELVQKENIVMQKNYTMYTPLLTY